MIKCPKCHKKIKYIISRDNQVLIADAVLYTLVTEKGSIVKGYFLHKCEEKKL